MDYTLSFPVHCTATHVNKHDKTPVLLFVHNVQQGPEMGLNNRARQNVNNYGWSLAGLTLQILSFPEGTSSHDS